MGLIPRVVTIVFALLIVLLIGAGFIALTLKTSEKGIVEQLSRFKSYRPYSFDINDLLSNDPNAFDTMKQNEFFGIGTSNPDPVFCKNLRSCIEMNLKGGSQCVIGYKVKPGTAFNINYVTETIKDRCPTIDMKEELYGDTGRKLCKFKQITNYNELREDNVSLTDYEPEIHNCYLPENLGSHNVLNDIDSINYLYSGRGSSDGYDFENGGTVRIVVTNVSIKNDPYTNCSYSLYVCGQNDIAASADETPVYIFKLIQYPDERELYFDETIFGSYSNIINLYGYHPRTYEFKFSGTCQSRGTCKEALIDAINAGMWEWSKINYDDQDAMKYFLDAHPSIDYIHFSYSPSLVSEDPNLNFDAGCWRNEYETQDSLARLSNSNNNFIFNRGIIFNNNKIRMVLGVKKAFFASEAKLAMDPVTFCSSETSSLPSLGCSDYNIDYVCNLNGCKWCSRCSGYKVNQWKQDNCVDPGVDCGYVCGDQFTPNECGAGDCSTDFYWSPADCSCIPSRDMH
jgi:hypothetical protein